MSLANNKYMAIPIKSAQKLIFNLKYIVRKMSKKSRIIFLFIIIVLAIFFRLFALDSVPPGLYHDEAMNGNNALEALETSEYKWFYSENNGREGLYINLLAIPLSLFGNETWALRLLSAIFGILTVLGVYLLTKELFKNERMALLASFFIAISFWHTTFSRIGFRGIMAPFFLVWAFYFLYKIINREKFCFIFASLGGLFFGLGFHSYIAYRVAPFLLIFPFYLLWKNEQKKYIFIFLLFTFIAGLPLGWYFLQNPADFLGRTSQVSIFSVESPLKEFGINIAKTIGMFFVYGDGNWRHNLAGSPQLWWPVAILFLFGVLKFGIWDLIKNLKFKIKNLDHLLVSPSIFLLIWIAIMLLPVVISSEGLPHALRAIIVIPPVMIFVALGLEKIITKINNWLIEQSKKIPDRKKQILRIRKEFALLLFAFLAIITMTSFSKYFFNWGLDLNTYHAFNTKYFELGQYLNELPKETEKFVIVNAGGVLVKNIPMPSQTIMFATKSYTDKGKNEKNIKYIEPSNISDINCHEKCIIATMEPDKDFVNQIIKNNEGLQLQIIKGGTAIYRK